MTSQRKVALGLVSGTFGAALLAIIVLGAVDLNAQQDPALLKNLWATGIPAALDPLAEVMAAVLGITLTVVAIVVQLAAQRYPAKIVDLFMVDRTNVLTFAFMAASCIFVVLAPAVTQTGHFPWVSAAALALTAINFTILLPYFAHVFSFLEPTNIISEIESRLRYQLRAALTQNSGAKAQREVAAGIDRIADNCMAAVAQSDRNLAIHSVRTLEEILIEYIREKKTYPKAWFNVEWNFSGTLAQEFSEEIVRQGTWLEAKSFMEFERILRRSLEEMNEVVSQLARSTRKIGEVALEAQDIQVLELVIRFFNTFVRHGLNRRNIRAVYNILYEYRRLAIALIHTRPEMARAIVEHLVYYGRSATDMGLPFVAVTVAHDVRVICQEACDQPDVDLEEMLQVFLRLDQPVEGKTQDVALIGVRKAQSILGAYLLSKDHLSLVETIRHDMREDDRARLTQVRDEILGVNEQKFWEITDRGHNFDYLETDLRQWLEKFFEPLIRSTD